MGVVEQALVALSPGEALLTATQVIVLDELLTWVIVLLLMLQVCVKHAQTNCWQGNEERQTLPDLVATCKYRIQYKIWLNILQIPQSYVPQTKLHNLNLTAAG